MLKALDLVGALIFMTVATQVSFASDVDTIEDETCKLGIASSNGAEIYTSDGRGISLERRYFSILENKGYRPYVLDVNQATQEQLDSVSLSLLISVDQKPKPTFSFCLICFGKDPDLTVQLSLRRRVRTNDSARDVELSRAKQDGYTNKIQGTIADAYQQLPDCHRKSRDASTPLSSSSAQASEVEVKRTDSLPDTRINCVQCTAEQKAQNIKFFNEYLGAMKASYDLVTTKLDKAFSDKGYTSAIDEGSMREMAYCSLEKARLYEVILTYRDTGDAIKVAIPATPDCTRAFSKYDAYLAAMVK